MAERCPWAVPLGTALVTRCMLPAEPPHPKHEGRGIERFDFQRVVWLAGDRREFRTELDRDYAWEVTPIVEPTEAEKAAARAAVRAMLETLNVPQDDWPPEVLEPEP